MIPGAQRPDLSTTPAGPDAAPLVPTLLTVAPRVAQRWVVGLAGGSRRVAGLLRVALLAGAPLAVASLGLATTTPVAETTIQRPVSRGQQLRVRSFAGRVQVVTSAHDHLRVETDAATAAGLLVELSGRTWNVVPADWESDAGGFDVDLPDRVAVRIAGREPRPVALWIAAPAWMPVIVESPRAEVSVVGFEAPVEVTTMVGAIRVDGGRSRVRLTSLAGRVEVERASGLVAVEGTKQPVVVRACEGSVRVEMTSGDVTLEDLTASDVEVLSLAGDLRLRGPVTPLARYRLTSHSGDIGLELSGPVDATFEIRAFHGTFRSPLVPAGAVEQGRGEFVLGDGSARLRLETFSGAVSVERAN